jgi:hypothetical protein
MVFDPGLQLHDFSLPKTAMICDPFLVVRLLLCRHVLSFFSHLIELVVFGKQSKPVDFCPKLQLDTS